MQSALKKNIIRKIGRSEPDSIQGAVPQVTKVDAGNATKRVTDNASKSPLAARPLPKEQLNRLAKHSELYMALGLVGFMAVLFVFGRIYYDERYYSPEEGIGYYLGLVGGSMMLVALAYTMFKYVAALRTRAVMRHWLTIHIFFGTAGPILVLIHSTFSIGSLNGGIALITMLLVFVSGVMGRFLYSKTHYGLGGQKARVKDLQEALKLAGRKIKSSRLEEFTESVLIHRDTLPHAIWELSSFGWRSRWLYFRLSENMRLHLNSMALEQNWDAASVRQKRQEFKKQLRSYIDTLEKVALFRVYERFFAFWRNAHVPLLYLLLMSGIVHVIAVHMY